jgi:hypothetical protein
VTQRLLDGLTDLWVVALDARREFSPGSPVAVLDRLLGLCDDQQERRRSSVQFGPVRRS